MTRALGTYSPFVLALTDALAATEDGWRFRPLEVAWTHEASGVRAAYLSGKGVRVEGGVVVSSGKAPAAAALDVAARLSEIARERVARKEAK